MLGFLKRALDFYMEIYGRPGTGITVYTAPDSVIDFYRMGGGKLSAPDTPECRPAGKSWIWGGGAVHLGSYRTGGGRIARPC
jgi:hypothetical protein